MKNLTTLFMISVVMLTLLFMTSNTANAQVSTYNFASSTGTYTEITGGTLLGTTTNDDQVFNNNTTGQSAPQTNTGFAIGFNFTYNGVAYDKFAVNTNGWILLGTGSFTIGGTYYPVSATGTGFVNTISALGRDLNGQSGATLRYEMIGSAPDRIIVVQWKTYRKYNATGDDFNFQIRLLENGNKVEFIYGTFTTTTSAIFEVGMHGATNADFNNRTTTTDWTASTAGGTNSATMTLSSTVFPPSGLTYTWNAAPMSYVSSTTTQNTSNVMRGTNDNWIIRIQVVTSGTENPISTTQFDLNTNGTTSTADISNAKIFYTGTSSTFATTTQFGSTNATPSGSYTITGSQALSGGTNYFWLTYDISSGATPENVVDAECTSLTVGGSPQTPTVTAPDGNRIIKTPLSGTKTVGPSGNYTTLYSAVSDLNTFGVEGATLFELQSDYSSAGETFPLSINAITGSSGTNTVTFRPKSDATGLVISGANTSGIIVLNGADYVTIDGRPGGSGTSKELTIENTSTSSTSTANTIRFINDADYNTMQYCTIKGGNSSAIGGVILFSTAGTTGNDNNTVSNCDITMTAAGWPTTAVVFSGTAAKANTNNTISLCNIFDWSVYGFYLGSNATNTTISQNNLYWTTTYSSTIVKGIFFNATTVGGTNILRNKIYDLKTNHATPFVFGMDFYYGSTTVTTVVNNFVCIDGSASTNNAVIYGIADRADPGQLFNIYYNSIYIGGTPTSGANNSYGYYRNYGSNTNFKNNIVSNVRANTEATGKNYAIYASNTANFVSNYNVLYSSGSVANSLVGYWGTADQATLSNWQTASSQDANSKSKVITFSDVTTGNLHLSGGSVGDVDLIAATGTGISDDFDGELRDAVFPYMGADEVPGYPLPITLASFVAVINPTGSGVLLEWSTISEINNYGFYIERRSESEENFVEIPGSFIAGAGTTLEPQSYSFIDNTLTSPGLYHYRLRQVDNDGLVHYTHSVSVEFSVLSVDEIAPKEFRVYQNYPNPFNPSTQIKFSVEKTEHAVVSVYNVLGQEVAVLFNGVAEPGKYYSLKFDGAKFTSGLYFYQLKTERFNVVKKMLLMK